MVAVRRERFDLVFDRLKKSIFKADCSRKAGHCAERLFNPKANWHISAQKLIIDEVQI